MLMYRVTEQGRRGPENTIALFGTADEAQWYTEKLQEDKNLTEWSYRWYPKPIIIREEIA